ncbi:Tropinesterase [Vibrio aerogenes CECT 7868]|uniref:Tropinesterase n=2 Tax=Vibrio aerogenes TaxID=92172 RepID=A0A1M5YG66_9VIBR|nr:Tropinesterase [Vibrio aerogenes CECT 7868]
MKTTGYILQDGGKIYYEMSGNPDGQPLLMMHGGLGCSDDMEVMMPWLSAAYLMLRIDFRGHGHSTLGDVPLSYAQYQKDVEAVLAHLNIHQYVVFGFSDGGTVGYRLAIVHPEQVQRLITLGAQWRLEKDDSSIEMLKGLTAEMWLQRYPDDVDKYNIYNPDPDFKRLVSQVKALWLDRSAAGYPYQSVEYIQCPTLVMHGENDFLFSLDEAVELYHHIPDCHFANIPLTAHAAHQEAPGLVGTMLNDFLLADLSGTDRFCD